MREQVRARVIAMCYDPYPTRVMDTPYGVSLLLRIENQDRYIYSDISFGCNKLLLGRRKIKKGNLFLTVVWRATLKTCPPLDYNQEWGEGVDIITPSPYSKTTTLIELAHKGRSEKEKKSASFVKLADPIITGVQYE